MKKLYELKFRFDYRPINFTDWEKRTVDFLDEHKNIKKVWLVNNQRKTGATYFAKLLLYFRKPCSKTFCISYNLHWSKTIDKQMPIEFYLNVENKEGEYYKVSNFFTPVTLFGLEKEIESDKKLDLFYEQFNNKNENKREYECLYDCEFNIEKYKILCSYNFNFFIINVSPKDLEKARPFIEADKDKEDVLIVNIENTFLPEYYLELLKE